MRVAKILAAAASLSISVMSQSAHAVPVLDQSNLGGSWANGVAIVTGAIGYQTYAATGGQTVTAGLSGGLTRVDMSLGIRSFGMPPDPPNTYVGARLSVLNSAGAIVATSVVSRDFIGEYNAGTFSNLVSFDLTSQNVFFTNGDVFTLLLAYTPYNSGQGSTSNLIWDLTTSFYSGGISYVNEGLGIVDLSPQSFRFATYVDPQLTATNVPAPGALALLGLGLLGLGARRRKLSA